MCLWRDEVGWLAIRALVEGWDGLKAEANRVQSLC
jgi:hypothetical protein